jgi:hypothetical protein
VQEGRVEVVGQPAEQRASKGPAAEHDVHHTSYLCMHHHISEVDLCLRSRSCMLIIASLLV